MIYRKMYGYALLDLMIALVFVVIPAMSSPVLGFITFGIYAFLHGYYGNAYFYADRRSDRALNRSQLPAFCALLAHSFLLHSD